MITYLNQRSVYAHREPFACDRIDVLIVDRTTEGGHTLKSVGEPLVMRPLTDKDYGVAKPPTFSLPPDAAQQLMDALWHCGLQPTEGSGSAGAMAATERHLADLQKLVFKTKKIP